MSTSPSLADPREIIARRAAREIRDGQLVNLGIGLPTLIPGYVPEHIQVWIHSENGIVGVGPQAGAHNLDAELIDAGGGYVTVVPGGAIVDSATSFGIIRRGLLDITFLGALQVSQHGDLANWLVPGKIVAGIGGGAELAQKARQVIVTMPHCDKDGRAKIVEHCELPLTARRCVTRIITEHAVFDIDDEGLLLREILGDLSLAQLQAITAPFRDARH
ncbi:acyl CoA:acetate/3-ketoacid CoA transferase subunit beta [Pseudomonas sp. AU11447]|uniref:3-oxoacid CoA-transferase subunit B n=1 Tax=unclassified Pseudomonas TaxID=196821 RepID=UPI0006D4781B|nr:MULTISPECIES: 3-oxoacid CoA-transferase subunit B [unclassified Pseudomonas]OBY88911.1 acyl CoA:acetate/3-ketoacid CoA transferase subunit beta [Pseudomonas sp. AU11447]